MYNFDVTAKCHENYVGTAKVDMCEGHNEPYKLSGCRLKMCSAPADTTGYTIEESSLAMHSFFVTARCSSGWLGTAAVKACTEPDGFYALSGCKDFCMSPAETTGYKVNEKDLKIKTFDVEASCLTGYIGTASVIPCSSDSPVYQLRGCTLDTRMCKAPPSTEGYEVSENSLVISTFDVSATCAKGGAWVQAPDMEKVKISPCVADQGLYRLSGCVPNKHCVAPKNLTGYIVNEKQLLISHFDVATSCAIGYAGKPVASACGDDGKPYILSGCEWDTNPCTSPKDTLGYRVKENDLIKSKFTVEVSCAPGYTGEAVADACPEPGKLYSLSGCVPE